MHTRALNTPTAMPVSFPRSERLAPGVANPALGGNACTRCRLRQRCLPTGLSEENLREFSTLIFSPRRVKAGQALYRAGDAFDAIYLVRRGFLKSIMLGEAGREQITGFHTEGDVVGIDAIGSERRTTEMVALEDSEVCGIPYARLEDMSRHIPALQRYLHRQLSEEIVRNHSMMFLLGTMRAEERLASFLLSLSERLTARGFSPSEFILRMTREEIGSFLGMKLETVSRAFSKFQREGMILVESKHVRLLDPEALQRLIGRQAQPQ